MAKRIMALALGAALIAMPEAAQATLADDCNAAADPVLQIEGCTLLIDSGALSETQRASAHLNRANAHLRRGRPAEALGDLDSSLALNPGNPRALNSRGVALRDLGRMEDAIADFTEAIRISPDLAAAYTNRGDTWQSMGEANAAIADWQRVIELEGAQRVEEWQTYLNRRGLYDGPRLGRLTPDTRAAIAACARDPEC